MKENLQKETCTRSTWEGRKWRESRKKGSKGRTAHRDEHGGVRLVLSQVEFVVGDDLAARREK
jgi:hypothetical protein